MPPVRATIRKVGLLYAVEIPAAVVRALGAARTIPVIARYLDEAHASTLTPARDGRARLFLRVAIFRPRGLGVGDEVEIFLAPDCAPRALALPLDLQRALQFRPAAAAAFARASPSTRRIAIELLEQSRTPETRARRLEKMIERLAENSPRRATKL